MKKILAGTFFIAVLALIMPNIALAAGISVSGGGSKYVGDSATVSFTATGATFNAFSGTISTSGPIKITATTAGKALWVTEPSGAGDFAGALTESTTSFKVVTLTVKGTGEGTGKIIISNVKLANKGSIVGSDGSSASFAFTRKPAPPGEITITSSTHPDQSTGYEATTAQLDWEKASGVTGFSYLLDQTAGTIPPTTVTDAATSATYTNLAVGIHYFHIRAINSDGWGNTTTFTINVKEPDPKVTDTLGQPHDLNIKKDGSFVNNIEDGTVSGLLITGITLPNYMANIKLDPSPTLPDNKLMSVQADENGHFEFLIDFPIKAGYYKLTVQGQDNKTLTPLSDPLTFEISQARGGSINLLTDADTNPPVIPTKKWYEKINYQYSTIGLLSVIILAGAGLVVLRFRSRRR